MVGVVLGVALELCAVGETVDAEVDLLADRAEDLGVLRDLLVAVVAVDLVRRVVDVLKGVRGEC